MKFKLGTTPIVQDDCELSALMKEHMKFVRDKRLIGDSMFVNDTRLKLINRFREEQIRTQRRGPLSLSSWRGRSAWVTAPYASSTLLTSKGSTRVRVMRIVWRTRPSSKQRSSRLPLLSTSCASFSKSTRCPLWRK